MQLARRALPSLRIAFYRIAAVLGTLLFSVVAARILGDENFGRYTALLALASTASILLGLGLPNLLEREIAMLRGGATWERTGALLRFAQILAISLCSIVGIGIAIGIPYAYTIGIFSVVAVAANSISAALRGYERVEITTIIESLLRPTLALTFMVSFAAFHLNDITTAITAQILSITCTTLVLLWLFRTMDHRLLNTAWTNSDALSLYNKSTKLIIIASANFTVVQLVVNLRTQAEIFWLTALASPEDVAHFFVATRAASAVSIFHGAVLSIAGPKIARLETSADIEQRNAVIGQSTRQSFILVVISSFVALLLAKPYFLAFGQSYLDAFWPMVIMLATWIGIASFGPVTQILIANGEERWVWYSFTVGLASGGVSAIIFIPIYGITGASISFLIMNTCTFLVILPRIYRILGTTWLLGL